VFTKRHPCPASGKVQATCAGYVVGYIKPLCAGGADRPSNMQWLAAADARKKERLDAQECRAYRKQKRT